MSETAVKTKKPFKTRFARFIIVLETILLILCVGAAYLFNKADSKVEEVYSSTSPDGCYNIVMNKAGWSLGPVGHTTLQATLTGVEGTECATAKPVTASVEASVDGKSILNSYSVSWVDEGFQIRLVDGATDKVVCLLPFEITPTPAVTTPLQPTVPDTNVTDTDNGSGLNLFNNDADEQPADQGTAQENGINADQNANQNAVQGNGAEAQQNAAQNGAQVN